MIFFFKSIIIVIATQDKMLAVKVAANHWCIHICMCHRLRTMMAWQNVSPPRYMYTWLSCQDVGGVWGDKAPHAWQLKRSLSRHFSICTYIIKVQSFLQAILVKHRLDKKRLQVARHHLSPLMTPSNHHHHHGNVRPVHHNKSSIFILNGKKMSA